MPRGTFDCPAAKANITINGSMQLGVTDFSSLIAASDFQENGGI
jgi:hypothetical protein